MGFSLIIFAVTFSKHSIFVGSINGVLVRRFVSEAKMVMMSFQKGMSSTGGLLVSIERFIFPRTVASSAASTDF